MPRQRRTRPQNLGANRTRSMRNNARRGGPSFSPNPSFQGGIGQGPSAAPGVQTPGQQRPGPRQGAVQCPTGQAPGRTPDGRMGCVPVRQGGAPGARPVGGQGAGGAGVPRVGVNPPNKQGY